MDSKTRVRTNDGIDGKDSVGLYLESIAKTPLLNAEEEVYLARRIEAGQIVIKPDFANGDNLFLLQRALHAQQIRVIRLAGAVRVDACAAVDKVIQ